MTAVVTMSDITFDLGDGLTEISVMSPEDRDYAPSKAQARWPLGWWAVSDGDGVVAYFAHEVDAYAFRMMQINLLMNGLRTLRARGLEVI